MGYKHIKEPLLECMRPRPCSSERTILLTLIAVTGEPEGTLWRAGKGYAPGKEGTNRINATLLALVRNEELNGMIQAMQDLERTWNHKFNYPWTFFNDVPFSDEFKRRTGAATKAQCNYGRIAVILHGMNKTNLRRIDSQRALGCPLLDRRRPLPRICQNPRGRRCSICDDGILPPNVPMEQRSLLQTSCSGEHTILLACGTKCTFLLRRRLRCLPVHARWQQNLRIHNQPLRLPSNNSISLARD